jgi:hypothetical protein
MWQGLDPDDLKSALTQPELDLFNQSQSSIDSPDRVLRILDETVGMVRGKVAAFAENRVSMGEDDTIPEELYGAAINIARYQFLTSFPEGKLFLDDGRTQLYKDALKQLDDAAKGTLFVQLSGSVQFVPDANRFGSRDDAVNDPTLFRNRNVIDFGFWH